MRPLLHPTATQLLRRDLLSNVGHHFVHHTRIDCGLGGTSMHDFQPSSNLIPGEFLRPLAHGGETLVARPSTWRGAGYSTVTRPMCTASNVACVRPVSCPTPPTTALYHRPVPHDAAGRRHAREPRSFRLLWMGRSHPFGRGSAPANDRAQDRTPIRVAATGHPVS